MNLLIISEHKSHFINFPLEVPEEHQILHITSDVNTMLVTQDTWHFYPKSYAQAYLAYCLPQTSKLVFKFNSKASFFKIISIILSKTLHENFCFHNFCVTLGILLRKNMLSHKAKFVFQTNIFYLRRKKLKLTLLIALYLKIRYTVVNCHQVYTNNRLLFSI
jgi:hypothetical protein